MERSSTLVWIDATNNELTSLVTLRSQSLVWCNVADNDISRLELGACPQLRCLQLDNNKVSSISPQLSVEAPNLTCVGRARVCAHGWCGPGRR